MDIFFEVNFDMRRKYFAKKPVTTAILVDGGFYRKRAKNLWGEKAPHERAKELERYCFRHLHDDFENRYLYRVLYYDCPPTEKNIFNPIDNNIVSMKNNPDFTWMNEFLMELKKRRKFALRMGRLNDNNLSYYLKPEATKDLLTGKLAVEDIRISHLALNIIQKGVDMRIGVDISSLAFKRQVDQIILISGDSDFVPAAKQARREGIDFILDPMRADIKDDLFEHIDGICTPRMNPDTGRDGN